MRLPQTLTKIETFLKKKKCTYEIIVVDDGSSDDTYEIVKNLNIDFLHILKNDQNK
jgi:glycosyltransferase involved in cell wall biosynthesis